MKKLVLIAASLGLIISSSFAQGYFYFDNSGNYGSTALLPTIGFSGGGYGEGSAGQVVGSDPTFATPNYDLTYLWMLGTTYSGENMDPLTFMSHGATQGAVANFLAPTGDSAGGAGVVSEGPQYPTGMTGSPNGTLITIELVAYYDPTGSGALPGHDQFDNFYGNIGWSQLETIRLVTAAGDPTAVDISGIPAFTVNAIIPEPSLPALSGVAATVLALVRRTKKRVPIELAPE